ncbi:MAG: DnaJ domain-containing protein [Gammaproteobacteria bacterium]|nr:DnaJ domain-containing protein [Gammaproteobacteria bacterium]
MRKSYSFEECYKILSTSSDCTWNDLRKSYKSQIQKWHPDRFEENSAKKKAAEEKIKNLNIAFDQLSRYFKENKHLPKTDKPEIRERIQPRQQEKSAQKDNATENSKPDSQPPLTKEKKHSIFWYVIIISVLIYVIYIITSDADLLPQSVTHTANPSKTNSSNTTSHTGNIKPVKKLQSSRLEETAANPKANHEPKKYSKEAFFTYGSTIRDVISIQGTPTKIDGDVWYYGESRVYFHDGIVIRWSREDNTPLNAGLALPDTINKTNNQ